MHRVYCRLNCPGVYWLFFAIRRRFFAIRRRFCWLFHCKSECQLYVYFLVVSSCPTCCTTNSNSILFWWKERKVDPPVIACTVHNWPAQGVHGKRPLRLRYLYIDFNSGNSGFRRNNFFLFLVSCVIDDAIDFFFVCASKCTFLLWWPVSYRHFLCCLWLVKLMHKPSSRQTLLGTFFF